jgi:4-hydroxy-tetrahydrodipicolinate synthase
MFEGMIVATITPMDREGSVDFPALERHLEFLVREGVDGIVCSGTTGEAPTLSKEENKDILRCTLSVCKGKVPVIAGTGCYDTKLTCQTTEEALRLGADGALVIVPYYNRPSPQGCIAHFSAVAQVGLPIIVYHHPVRTGLKLSADTLLEICAFPGIVGIKEGPGDIDLTMELARKTDKPILTGDDFTTLPCMSVGAKGIISVMGNIIPSEWKSMVDKCAEGKMLEALQIFRHYLPLCRSIFSETNPIGVKYALSIMGTCSSRLRLPLIEPADKNKALIEECIKIVQKINSQIF